MIPTISTRVPGKDRTGFILWEVHVRFMVFGAELRILSAFVGSLNPKPSLIKLQSKDPFSSRKNRGQGLGFRVWVYQE